MTDPTGAHHDHTHAVYAAAPILAEAVLAVAELHYAVNGAPDWCKECGFRWPCPTARALGIAQRPAGPDGEAGA
jgi:hypothetical protein